MPNWKTHLEVANRLNKKLNFSGYDLELFLIGNILPDINNGHIVKDVSIHIKHKITHFDGEDFNTYKRFGNIYNIYESPLYLGYYTHLYTDYYFNNNFYSKLNDEYKHLDRDELRILKQSDFRIFNNNFNDNKIYINNVSDIVKEVTKIDRVFLINDDIVKVVNYINNQDKYEGDYKYFSNEELNIVLNDTVNNLEKMILPYKK